MTEPTFEQRWRDLGRIWRDNRWLYLLAGVLIGVMLTPLVQRLSGDAWALAGELVPVMIGVIVTVLVIEGFNRRARREANLRRLIREMRSSDAEEGVAAAREASDLGFLDDGSLSRASFSRGNLEKANFMHAKLKRVMLMGTNLRNANLHDVDLQNALMTGTNLSGANLVDADLSNALLHNANLEDADIEDGDLSGANLYQVNFKGTDISGARFDSTTILPDSEKTIDESGRTVYPDRWTPGTDMTRYTDPNHPEFWQPKWAAARFDSFQAWVDAGSPAPDDTAS